MLGPVATTGTYSRAVSDQKVSTPRENLNRKSILTYQQQEISPNKKHHPRLNF